MEDSTVMTIDFLRARLLSERSVSRTAKQRADELAKRVVELEEQLKTVTLQRKKAEKATIEVLAILENHRINDVLEAFDSNSDQERAPSDTKDDNNSMKEEESSVTSKRGNEVEVISGSELEDSPPSGRSLSWKSCSDTPSLEKKISIDKSRRREYGFSSSSISSSKSREGKSCRQIRRMDFISASDEVGYESFLFDAQEDGGTSGTGDNSDDFKDRPGITKEGSKNDEKVYSEDPDSIKDEQRESDAGFDVNGSKTHDDMERAVEDQAQNVAQEDAQREWEERFQENDSRSVESYEPGNQSDMTTERDDPREVVDPSDIIPSCRQEGTLEKENALGIEEERSKMRPNVTLSATSLEMVCSQDQQYKSTSVDERGASFSEFTFTSQETPRSAVKGKEKQDSPGTLSCESSDYQSTKESSLQVKGNETNGQPSGNLNKPQLAICWHEAPNELEVLQELQRAKLSLKQQLDRSRLTTKAQPATRTETPSLAIEAASSTNIPIGCAGLFRLPTDLELEATNKAKPLRISSNSGLDMTKYSPNVGGMGSDQQRTSHNLGISSRDSFQKHYFDPQMSLPSPHRYTSPSYADLMPKMTSYDGVPRSFPSFRPEMPANDRYSLYSGHVRLTMHHRY